MQQQTGAPSPRRQPLSPGSRFALTSLRRPLAQPATSCSWTFTAMAAPSPQYRRYCLCTLRAATEAAAAESVQAAARWDGQY